MSIKKLTLTLEATLVVTSIIFIVVILAGACCFPSSFFRRTHFSGGNVSETSLEGVIKNVQSNTQSNQSYRSYRPVIIEFDDGRVVIGLDVNKVTTFKKGVNNRIYYHKETITSICCDENPDK